VALKAVQEHTWEGGCRILVIHWYLR
jgi:hypothetical protein